jgi:hypothetical protein
MWTRILVLLWIRKGHGESLFILPELPLASQRVVDWEVWTNSAFNIPRAILCLSLRGVATVR